MDARVTTLTPPGMMTEFVAASWLTAERLQRLACRPIAGPLRRGIRLVAALVRTVVAELQGLQGFSIDNHRHPAAVRFLGNHHEHLRHHLDILETDFLDLL